jgi:hypothetical protein
MAREVVRTAGSNYSVDISARTEAIVVASPSIVRQVTALSISGDTE